MGQQQLLLLVLATVIVGLATVAGIQAFDEGQTQATQDALTQRAIEIGNNIAAADAKPTQMGGINVGGSGYNAEDAAKAAGYDSTTPSADGAGDGASCEISSTGTIVKCSSDGAYSNSGSNEYVKVTVDPDRTEPVKVTNINGRKIGSV
jgi:hypothetical protein